MGIAIISENSTYIFKLPESCSIYTVEAIAIPKIVELILNQGNFHRNNIILSNFISTLQSLNNTTNTTDIAKLIQQKINQSTSWRANIFLIWIPGHSNIKENKKVDEGAKKAAKSSDIPKLNITTYADLKNQIKNLPKLNDKITGWTMYRTPRNEKYNISMA